MFMCGISCLEIEFEDGVSSENKRITKNEIGTKNMETQILDFKSANRKEKNCVILLFVKC